MTWGFCLLATRASSKVLNNTPWRNILLPGSLLRPHISQKKKNYFNSPLTASIRLWVYASTWVIEQCLLWHHKGMTARGNRWGTFASFPPSTLPEDERWEKARSFSGGVISGLAGWIMWPGSWRPLKHIGIYGLFRPSYRQPLNGLVKPLSGGNVEIAASITRMAAAFPLQYNLIVPVLIEPVGSAATC